MPGLVPGIHVFTSDQVVDGPVKPGHNEGESHERFTSARNAFTGFSEAGTRLR